MPDDDYPRARVIEVEGRLVLDDPDAYAIATAIAKHNCRQSVLIQKDRLVHFIRRIVQLKRSPKEVMITFINVDSRWGNTLADLLMPGMTGRPTEIEERSHSLGVLRAAKGFKKLLTAWIQKPARSCKVSQGWLFW